MKSAVIHPTGHKQHVTLEQLRELWKSKALPVGAVQVTPVAVRIRRLFEKLLRTFSQPMPILDLV
jgi:hypothetical protein